MLIPVRSIERLRVNDRNDASRYIETPTESRDCLHSPCQHSVWRDTLETVRSPEHVGPSLPGRSVEEGRFEPVPCEEG